MRKPLVTEDLGCFRWQRTGSLVVPRALARVVPLADGRVLVTGGVDVDGKPMTSSEVWDPGTETFSRDGSVLDLRGNLEVDALTWDFGARRWDKGRQLPFADEPGRCLLPDGALVEIAPDRGGTDPAVDGASDEVVVAPPLASAPLRLFQKRAQPTVTVLTDGRVLVTGGFQVHETLNDYVHSGELRAEILDLRAGRVAFAGMLKEGRHWHAAAELPDGRVMLVGGRDLWNVVEATVEIGTPVPPPR